jgi:hypothetical protein
MNKTTWMVTVMMILLAGVFWLVLTAPSEALAKAPAPANLAKNLAGIMRSFSDPHPLIVPPRKRKCEALDLAPSLVHFIGMRSPPAGDSYKTFVNGRSMLRKRTASLRFPIYYLGSFSLCMA